MLHYAPSVWTTTSLRLNVLPIANPLPLPLDPLLRHGLGPFYPLIIYSLALSEFRCRNTFDHLPNEPHKIMSPQRILPHPGVPLLYFLIQHIGVPDLLRPDPHIPDHGQQVESDLIGRVALYAAPQDRDDSVREFLKGGGAMGDRGGLETVEFVEYSVNGRIGYEVVHIVVFCGEALGFVNERGGARKGVVDVAN